MTIRPHLGLDRAGGGIDGDTGILPDVSDDAGDPRWVNCPRAGDMPRPLAPDREGPQAQPGYLCLQVRQLSFQNCVFPFVG